MKNWPDKEQRERFEINGFISAYKKLDHGRSFKIVSEQDKPDYIVQDTNTGEEFGVELTSVYLNDRSVPDEHRKPHNGPVDITHNPEEIKNYKSRMIKAIQDKNNKAKKFDRTNPLILAIYINEYCAIFMDEVKEWEQFVKDNEWIFNGASSFSEIVFWNLPNNGVFSVITEPPSSMDC